MKIKTRILLALLCVFPLAAEAHALEFMPLTMPELIRKSSEIVHATCISAEGVQTGGGYIVTAYTFSPHAFAKGSLPDPFSFSLAGGSVGDESMFVADMPTFTPGNEYILFLKEGLFILSGDFRVRSSDRKPDERVLQYVPRGFPLYSAASGSRLPYGSELSVDDFFFSIKRFMPDSNCN